MTINQCKKTEWDERNYKTVNPMLIEDSTRLRFQTKRVYARTRLYWGEIFITINQQLMNLLIDMDNG